MGEELDIWDELLNELQNGTPDIPDPETSPSTVPETELPGPFAPPVPKNDEEPNWVVRAGEAKPKDLQTGYGTVRDSNPLIYGISVQYKPGVPLGVLSMVGFPNKKLSIATDVSLIEAGGALGYAITLIDTPQGYGAFHHTLNVRNPDGSQLTELPSDLAAVLSSVFRQIPNPNIVKRG